MNAKMRATGVKACCKSNPNIWNMKNTTEAIIKACERLEKWGCLEGLTKGEKEDIVADLKQIALCAIMEAHNKIQNTLPDMYSDFMKNHHISPFKQ